MTAKDDYFILNDSRDGEFEAMKVAPAGAKDDYFGLPETSDGEYAAMKLLPATAKDDHAITRACSDGEVTLVKGGITNLFRCVENRLEVWDGSAWADYKGYGGGNGKVYDVALYKKFIYITGSFPSYDGVTVSKIARIPTDRSAWEWAGAGITLGNGILFATIGDDLMLFPVPNSIQKMTIDGLNTYRGAKWDGTVWSKMIFEFPDTTPDGFWLDVIAVTKFDEELYACGYLFANQCRTFTKWESTTQRWASTAPNTGWTGWADQWTGESNEPRVVIQFGADMWMMGGTKIKRNTLAQDRTSTWETLPDNWTVNGHIRCAAVYRGELYVAGGFTGFTGASAGFIARNSWAKYDPVGDTWVNPTGGAGTGTNTQILQLVVFGDELILGGSFTTFDGDTIRYVAAWDGTEIKNNYSVQFSGFPASTYRLRVIEE